MTFATQAAHLGVGWDSTTGAVSVPIYQTATFAHSALGATTGYDYSRTRNPTRQVLEDSMALLDGGARGFAYSSGMAAIASLMLLFNPGDQILVTEDLYGGSFRLFEQCSRRYGVSFAYVDTTDLSAVRAAVRPQTRGLFVESLTNPLLKVADVSALCALAKEHGLLTIVDNTFLTPYLLRPLSFGADVAVYSGTKYLAGHNDTVCGLAVVREPSLAEKVAFHHNAIGAILGPQDSWLTLRGLKTLSIRLDRQQDNAAVIANWLLKHPRVTKVYYPGLPEHAGHELACQQLRGYGGMVSFEVAAPSMVESLLSRIRLITFAESLGGAESLITFPAVQTHSDLDENTRKRLGITSTLLRLSVGIESSEDLVQDLDQALGQEESA